MYCCNCIRATAKFLLNYGKNRENCTNKLLSPNIVECITKIEQRRQLIYGAGGTIQPGDSQDQVFQL